jgi:hypothetical protein
MDIDSAILEYEFMEGNNKLEFCELALEQAVEFWLNTKIFRQPVSVQSIRTKTGTSTTYEIEIKSIPHLVAGKNNK